MRVSVLIIVLFVVAVAGCEPSDCLPEPSSDETLPEVRLTVHFLDPNTARRDSTVVTAGDPASSVEADLAGEIVVVYAGSDEEGMKRLALSAFLQESVGAGVQRQALDIDPVTASCPKARLQGRETISGEPGQRVVLAVLAESWQEQRAFTENLAVKLR